MKASCDPNASYKLIGQALAGLGYSMEEYEAHKYRVATYTKGSRKWITQIDRLSYPSTHRLIRDVSARKSLAYAIAEKFDVPIPFTHVVEPDDSLSLNKVNEWIDKYGKLVVKPEQASLSRGLTTGVDSYEDIVGAVDYARQFSGEGGAVLIQQQVSGDEIRFVYLGGSVVAALLRESAHVVGDGISTLGQLIDKENISRSEISDSMVDYPQIMIDQVGGKLDPTMIPMQGHKIVLSLSSMISGGASVYNVMNDVNFFYIDIAEKMARAVGAGFIVVDMIIDDYRQTGGVYFNEFNVSPVLKLFYSCRDGNNYDILPDLARHIDNIVESSMYS